MIEKIREKCKIRNIIQTTCYINNGVRGAEPPECCFAATCFAILQANFQMISIYLASFNFFHLQKWWKIERNFAAVLLANLHLSTQISMEIFKSFSWMSASLGELLRTLCNSINFRIPALRRIICKK